MSKCLHCPMKIMFSWFVFYRVKHSVEVAKLRLYKSDEPAALKDEVETPAALPGVQRDGSPNTVEIVRDQSYWQSAVGGFGSVDEQFVQDAGWVRLRELSLSYSINPSIFSDSKFIQGISVGFIGRNLWYSTQYDGVDPETSLTGTGNAQGLDYFNQPSTRSFLFNVNVDF